MLYCLVLHCTVLPCTVLPCTVLPWTVLPCIVQHCCSEGGRWTRGDQQAVATQPWCPAPRRPAVRWPLQVRDTALHRPQASAELKHFMATTSRGAPCRQPGIKAAVPHWNWTERTTTRRHSPCCWHWLSSPSWLFSCLRCLVSLPFSDCLSVYLSVTLSLCLFLSVFLPQLSL